VDDPGALADRHVCEALQDYAAQLYRHR
jgi:hypothetical protein